MRARYPTARTFAHRPCRATLVLPQQASRVCDRAPEFRRVEPHHALRGFVAVVFPAKRDLSIRDVDQAIVIEHLTVGFKRHELLISQEFCGQVNYA